MPRRRTARGHERAIELPSESERFRTLIENLPLVTYADSGGTDATSRSSQLSSGGNRL